MQNKYNLNFSFVKVDEKLCLKVYWSRRSCDRYLSSSTHVASACLIVFSSCSRWLCGDVTSAGACGW